MSVVLLHIIIRAPHTDLQCIAQVPCIPVSFLVQFWGLFTSLFLCLSCLMEDLGKED